MNLQDNKNNMTTEDTEKAQSAQRRSKKWALPVTKLEGAAEKLRTTLAGAVASSKGIARSTGKKIVDHATAAVQSSRQAGQSVTNHASILLNAILASDFSKSMESWLGSTFNEGVPSVYDAAVDAVYNATHVGGGHLHRLFDGSHSPWSMWGKVHEALPDDTFAQEVAGYSTALWKDLSSSVGIPLFDWNKVSYDRVANALRDTFHIPKSWFSDLLHVNATELVGSVIASIAVSLRWSKAEVQEFSETAGALGISAMASANPALAVVALVALAKSYTDAKGKQEHKDLMYGLSRGGVGTAMFLTTASVVGGPVWVGLVVGMCTASVSRKGMDKARAGEVSAFVKATLTRARPASSPDTFLKVD